MLFLFGLLPQKWTSVMQLQSNNSVIEKDNVLSMHCHAVCDRNFSLNVMYSFLNSNVLSYVTEIILIFYYMSGILIF